MSCSSSRPLKKLKLTPKLSTLANGKEGGAASKRSSRAALASLEATSVVSLSSTHYLPSIRSFHSLESDDMENVHHVGLELTCEEEEASPSLDVKTPNLKSATLLDLPDDLLAQVGSFLNVTSLCSSCLVCRKLCTILSRDEAGWTWHCQRLWRGKVHVSQKAQKTLQESITTTVMADKCGARTAYIESCKDAQNRQEITNEELIYNPKAGQNTVWSFRFKGSAGMEWTAHDPWYAGLPARKMVFLANGSVRQLDEQLVGDVDHPDSSRTISKLRAPFFDNNHPTGVNVTWRVISQPMDMPHKEAGAYIRLNVGGRDVPTYLVHRSPNNNWGFLLENCWGVFASFPLPSVQQMQSPVPAIPSIPRFTHSSEEGTPLNERNQQARSPNDSLLTAAIANAKQMPRYSMFHDLNLPVTSQKQWREALLYNLGNSLFPDGPLANAEFDEFWNSAVSWLRALGFSLDNVTAP